MKTKALPRFIATITVNGTKRSVSYREESETAQGFWEKVDHILALALLDARDGAMDRGEEGPHAAEEI